MNAAPARDLEPVASSHVMYELEHAPLPGAAQHMPMGQRPHMCIWPSKPVRQPSMPIWTVLKNHVQNQHGLDDVTPSQPMSKQPHIHSWGTQRGQGMWGTHRASRWCTEGWKTLVSKEYTALSWLLQISSWGICWLLWWSYSHQDPSPLQERRREKSRWHRSSWIVSTSWGFLLRQSGTRRVLRLLSIMVCRVHGWQIGAALAAG